MAEESEGEQLTRMVSEGDARARAAGGPLFFLYTDDGIGSFAICSTRERADDLKHTVETAMHITFTIAEVEPDKMHGSLHDLSAQSDQ